MTGSSGRVAWAWGAVKKARAPLPNSLAETRAQRAARCGRRVRFSCAPRGRGNGPSGMKPSGQECPSLPNDVLPQQSLYASNEMLALQRKSGSGFPCPEPSHDPDITVTAVTADPQIAFRG